MIEVTPHARRHADRAGDPLDGLVNMFDLGIVLAVAFLLAALQSAHLTTLLTDNGKLTVVGQSRGGKTLVVKRGQQLHTLQLSSKRVAGSGAVIGSVYRLNDGRLVYVTKKKKTTR
jgi:hypothetical protein